MRRLLVVFSGLARSLLSRFLADFIMNTVGRSSWQGQLLEYSISLVDRYAEMSAVGALIFYSLFVMSTNTRLVVTIPLVIFGLFRYWYVVEAKEAGESPTDALLTDWPLIAGIAAWGVACIYALRP